MLWPTYHILLTVYHILYTQLLACAEIQIQRREGIACRDALAQGLDRGELFLGG